MKNIINLLLIILLIASPLQAQRRAVQRNLIEQSIHDKELRYLVNQPFDYFPAISQRDVWEGIPERYKKEYIQKAEEYLKMDFSPILLVDWLAYNRVGDRSVIDEKQRKERTGLSVLVIAECIENQGRFTDMIANLIWMIMEESSWSNSAHLNIQNRGLGLPDTNDPVVELISAETAQILAWSHYLLKDKLDQISPLINERLYEEIDRRILSPYMNCFYGYFGWDRENVNNWNPWINSNVFTCAMIFEKNPIRKYYIVKKIICSADKFINWYTPDGGCDEGPAYWGRAGRMLYYLLSQLYTITDGRIDLFNQEIIKNIGRYIAKTYISNPYYVNFADASATILSEADAGSIYLWGKRTDDKIMQDFGSYLLVNNGINVDYNMPHMGLSIAQLLALKDIQKNEGKEPLMRDVSLSDIQVFAARSKDDSRDGFYFAAKGGHNDESHNHNDVGNFIVYHDGQPVIIDAGVAVYKSITFTDKRYTLWHTQSSYHNCPAINGYMQKEGKEYAASDLAYCFDAKSVNISMDISKAYPRESGVNKWSRSFVFDRASSLTINESFELNKLPTQANQLFLLTALQPHIQGKTLKLIASDKFIPTREFTIDYDVSLVADIQIVKIDDPKLSKVWGDKIYRIVFTDRQKRKVGNYQIRIR